MFVAACCVWLIITLHKISNFAKDGIPTYKIQSEQQINRCTEPQRYFPHLTNEKSKSPCPPEGLLEQIPRLLRRSGILLFARRDHLLFVFSDSLLVSSDNSSSLLLREDLPILRSLVFFRRL